MEMYLLNRDYRLALFAFAATLGVAASQIDAASISPFDVELHQPLSNSTTTYSSELKTGSGKSWESKLTSGDIFFCYGMAIQVTKYDHTAATAYNRPLYSYPEPAVFPTTEGIDLEKIWNGSLEVKTGSTVRVSNWRAQHFRYVPVANQVGANLTPSVLPSYGPSFEERGFHLWAGYPIFKGDESNVITLNLAPGTNTAIAGTAGVGQNQLVFKLTGFKYTGPSSVGGCTV